jgi:hypothetical protein
MPMSLARLLPAAALLLAAVCTAPLHAQVVVDGGAPNGNVGWDIFNDTRLAAAFTVSPGGLSFDGIRFWGILASGPSYSPDIYWQILGDAGGMPDDGSVAAEGHAVATASSASPLAAFPGFDSWQFDLAAGPQSLAAGTFWLALHDGAPDPTGESWTNIDFYWESTDGGSPFMSESISAGLGWGQQGDAGLAFGLVSAQQVTATPEPASLLLFATGAAGIAAIAAVRRRSHGSTGA